MKRNMDLVRKVLLSVQDNSDEHLTGFSEDEIKYHQRLVIEVDLAEGKIHESISSKGEVPSAVFIKKLTWSGHDFIDAIESESNWNKVKEFLAEAGKQLTIDTVKFAVGQLFGVGA